MGNQNTKTAITEDWVDVNVDVDEYETEEEEEDMECDGKLLFAFSLSLALSHAFISHTRIPCFSSHEHTYMVSCFISPHSTLQHNIPFRNVSCAEEMMRQVLADAKRLRFMADAFLHPEKPVVSTGCYCDGCYYDRPSAPPRLSREEADEQFQILTDATSLGRLAHTYAHPEEPVVTTDPAACARCYYDRPSAPARLSVEDAEEQAAIMSDLDALRRAARDYLHPELQVTTSDPTACGRNYFTLYSAPEQESLEEAEYRAAVLADAAALKLHAVWHAHPELPVVSSDPNVCARNYFNRCSAPDQESPEEAEYRAAVLADAAALKLHAVWHAHPELPMVSNPVATARCYFDRASAPYDFEQIISTSAYSAEKKQETLEKHMETLESLVPATTTKVAPAIGPCTSVVQSASNVQLYDLEFA